MEDMESMEKTGARFMDLSRQVIGSAIEVHRTLGPGLLESTYRRCLRQELAVNGVPVEIEAPIAIQYKGLSIECAYRIDLFVNRQIVVEIKSVEALKWIHEAQVITYMRLSRAPRGLLINFSSRRLMDGLRSYVL
jgi:GxxExxY protein